MCAATASCFPNLFKLRHCVHRRSRFN
uniref:Uncharacterized protein n=1 Tax=Anopheles arabiensis TaxID=7173 RepID=A0A182IHR0_ANOAR